MSVSSDSNVRIKAMPTETETKQAGNEETNQEAATAFEGTSWRPNKWSAALGALVAAGIALFIWRRFAS
jgi:hypothetical protein